MKRREPHDVEIGKRVRVLRVARGMTQSDLGQALGVTFQQVQKYENGQNRIASGRLQTIAEAFDVPITYFFSADKQSSARGKSAVPDFYSGRGDEVKQLVEAYARIESTKIRLGIVHLAEKLASGG